MAWNNKLLLCKFSVNKAILLMFNTLSYAHAHVFSKIFVFIRWVIMLVSYENISELPWISKSPDINIIMNICGSLSAFFLGIFA